MRARLFAAVMMAVLAIAPTSAIVCELACAPEALGASAGSRDQDVTCHGAVHHSPGASLRAAVHACEHSASTISSAPTLGATMTLRAALVAPALPASLQTATPIRNPGWTPVPTAFFSPPPTILRI